LTLYLIKAEIYIIQNTKVMAIVARNEIKKREKEKIA